MMPFCWPTRVIKLLKGCIICTFKTKWQTSSTTYEPVTQQCAEITERPGLPDDIIGCRCLYRLCCWQSSAITTESETQDSKKNIPLYTANTSINIIQWHKELSAFCKLNSYIQGITYTQVVACLSVLGLYIPKEAIPMTKYCPTMKMTKIIENTLILILTLTLVLFCDFPFCHFPLPRGRVRG